MKKLWRLVPERYKSKIKDHHDQQASRIRQQCALTHLRNVASSVSSMCLEGCNDLKDWTEKRTVIKQQFLWMLGLDPLPNRTALDPCIVEVLDRGQYVIEKIILQSLPSLFLTANFYRPKQISGPVPCILYQCGHQLHPNGAKTQYQDRFLWYPAHGFACLAMDSLQCGEVAGIHHGTHSLDYWHWLSMGYTPAGVEVWNAMRALDWLTTRPEVDSQRIGATGISGGGVMTWFLTAVDDRIKAAAPSCSAYTIATQVDRRLVPYQCDCTYFPNVFRLDFPAIGALIAPRPLLFTCGKKDRIFPPAGYREVYRLLSGIYKLFSSGEAGDGKVRLIESNQGHADPPEFLRESRDWMCRWLVPEQPCLRASVNVQDPRVEDEKLLVCIREIPKKARNYSIQEEFIPRRKLEPVLTQNDWKQRRKELLSFLKSKVFSWFLSEKVTLSAKKMPGQGGHAVRFANFTEWELETEPKVNIKVLVYQPKSPSTQYPLLVTVKGQGEQTVFPDDRLLPLLNDHRVIVLMPRFTEWTPSGREYAEAERTAALTGRTLVAMQIWDVLQTIRWVLEVQKYETSELSIFGRGFAGVVALYTALFDERIGKVIIEKPPSSHRAGATLLTILRETDLPEIAGLLAPRKIIFLGGIPEAYAYTRQLFNILGCSPHCRSSDSLTQAMLHSSD